MDSDGDTYTDFAKETHGSNSFHAGSIPAGYCVFANDADCDGCYDSAITIIVDVLIVLEQSGQSCPGP